MLLAYTLVFAFILCLIALAGCFSEHGGIINIGLEGIMVVSALAGALVMQSLYPAIENFPNWLRALSIIVATCSASILIGMLYSTLLGIAAIHFKSDQILIGTAINLLGVALASVIAKSINLSFNPENPSYIIEYIQPRESFILNINGFEFNWFMLITIVILVASYVVLYKTRFGLRLIACGENPHAATSAGINVLKMRWYGVLISGALAGLGGLSYIIANKSSWDFSIGVQGYGFLGLAVMIAGRWTPQRIVIFALLFGFCRTVAILTNATHNFLSIPSNVYLMLPYLISLIVLVFTSTNSKAPKAEGIPY